MGKRKHAKMFLDNILSGEVEIVCQFTECDLCDFFLSEKYCCTFPVFIDDLHTSRKYLEKWLEEHPKKFKKLPYDMFERIRSELDLEEPNDIQEAILWLNGLIKEYGYEVKE